MLGNWATAKGEPLYAQLAQALQRAVIDGDVLAGTRLPAERTLAKQLAVSRSTILSAYRLLKADGFIETRQGSGTWLTHPAYEFADAGGGADPTRSLQANAFLRRGAHTPIDFATAALPAAQAVAEEARSAVADDLPSLLAGHGYLPAGLRELRQAVARRFGEDGVPTTEAEVLAVNGNQQAITLAVALLLKPGDVAVVENPASPGVLDALRAARAEIRSFPVGENGADLGGLRELVMRWRVRLIYLTPTFHSPTGTTLGRAGREELAELARELQVTVVEDLGPADLPLTESAPPSPVAAHAPQQTISIGSMSKLYWAGLRTGWVRAPEHLIGQMMRLKAAADLGSPLLSQLISARLLARRDEIQHARRAYLLPRLDRLTTLLADGLPDWEWRRPEGGLVLWVRLPRGNATEFAQVASRHGVVFVAGPLLSADESSQDRVRLSFGIGRAEIDEGLERLRQAWAAYEPHAEPQPELLGGLT
jgi:DNA-binding transcriptional MocR family regulator